MVYLSQFVALEMFFRGWWIHTTRIFGTGAIFSMMVPYAITHFGKPYLERKTLRFNLSDTKDAVLIAFTTDTEIGAHRRMVAGFAPRRSS